MGTITLRAPDGTSRKFGIAGNTPTPDEIRRFNKIMAQTNPAPVQEDPTANMPNPANVAQDQNKLFIQAGNALGTVGTRTEPSPEAPSTPTDDTVSRTPRPEIEAPREDTVSAGSLAQAQTPVGQEVVSPTPSAMSEISDSIRGPEYNEKRENPDQYPNFLSGADQNAIENEQKRNDQRRAGAIEARGDDPEMDRGTNPLGDRRDNDVVPTPDTTPPVAPARDLPAPSSGMFDALSGTAITAEEKSYVVTNKLNEYMNHPRTVKRWDGRYIYTDANGDEWRVPRIYWNKATNKAEVLDSWSLEGMEDGIKNTAEFVGDVLDLTRNLLSDETITDEESFGQWIRDNTSQYSEEGRGLRALGGEAAGILAGGGPLLKGARVAGNVFKSTKQVGKLRASVNAMTKAGVDAVLLTAPIDGESSGLFLGEDATFKASDLMPILEGLDPNATDAEWQQRLENRRNMILEGAALTSLFSGTVKGATAGISMVNSLTVGGFLSTFRKTAQQKAAMSEIMESLLRAEGATTAAERKQFMEAFAATMDKYAVEVNEINDGIINFAQTDRSTMNAFLTAIDEGDFQSAADVAYRFQNPDAVANAAQSLQQGALTNPSLTNTAIKSEAAQSTYVDAVNRGDQAVGGVDSINRGARIVQEGSEDAAVVAAKADEIPELESALDTLDARLIQEINTGGELSSRLNRLSQLTGITLNSRADSAIDSVVSRVAAAYRNLKTQRTAQYAKVSGGALDERGLFEFLREMDPADLSEAATTLGYAPRLKALLEAVADRKKTVSGDTVSGIDNFDPVPTGRQSVAVPDDELFADFQQALKDAEIVDYGSLFQNLRADLARTKSDLFEAGGNAQKSAGRSINDLVKYIDGELLDSTGDVELLENVSKAIEWDQTNFIPLFGDKDTALGQVANLYDSKIDPTVGGLTGVARNTSFEDMARATISSNLGRGTRSNAEAIVSLLQRPEAGSTDELIDFVMFETLSPIMSKLRVGGAAPDQSDIITALNNLSLYETVIRRANPKLADELGELGDAIQSGTYNRDDLVRELADAKDAHQNALERLRTGATQDFFSTQGIPVQIGMDSYNGLINNFVSGGRQNVGRLETITKQFMELAAEGNKLPLEGLQAAYLKRFRQATTTTSDGATKSGGISQTRLREAADLDISKWEDGLRMVFPDSPDTAELLISLYRKAGTEQGYRTARPDRINSATALRTQQIEKLGTIITLVYGNLSRTGARLRRAGTAAINKNFNKAAWDELQDDLFSNPQAAKQAVEMLMKEEFGTSTTRSVFNSVIDSLVYAGWFGPEDEEEARAMNYEVIMATAEAEANVRDYTRDGKTFLGDLYDQSVELFSDTFLR